MLNGSGHVLRAPYFNNSSIFSVTPPVNFDLLTDTITTEGQTVIFTHYWSVEEIITTLAPVWIILYILLSFAVFYYFKRSHNAN